MIDHLSYGDHIKIHGLFRDINVDIETDDFIHKIYKPSILIFDRHMEDNQVQNLFIVEPKVILSPSEITGS